MKARETGRRKRKNKDRLGNRLAVIGISVVVLSLAVVVNVKNTSMEKKVPVIGLIKAAFIQKQLHVVLKLLAVSKC